ncbi:hypothetical protein NM688_g1197 [Phlebia brevispora]|uniref:Uncharacterized protein n=1 Tax=Phlebia brevispora TaxID=194682 RepID=A0ACC1TC03_9APHY|nr:hypothetical protein NM688_g1197 [Phlebia brevispora]
MLKSLLPSRKLPDAEFTMLTTGLDPPVNGKENYPAVGTNVSRLRGEKTKKHKGKEVSQEVPTEQAFDKLLVCRIHCPTTYVSNQTCRMISKYPPRLDPNSRRWSRP